MNWFDCLLLIVAFVVAYWTFKRTYCRIKKTESEILIVNEGPSETIEKKVVPKNDSWSENVNLEQSEIGNEIINIKDLTMCSGYGSTEDETHENLFNKSQTTDNCSFDRLRTSPKSDLTFSSYDESDSANTGSYEQLSIELELTKNSYMENEEHEIKEGMKTFFTTRKLKNTMKYEILSQDTTENENNDIINVLDTFNNGNKLESKNAKLTDSCSYHYCDNNSSSDSTESLPSSIYSNNDSIDIEYVDDCLDERCLNLSTTVDNMNDAFIQLEE